MIKHKVRYVDSKGRIKAWYNDDISKLHHIEDNLRKSELPFWSSSNSSYGYDRDFDYMYEIIKGSTLDVLYFLKEQQQKMNIINFTKNKTSQWYYINSNYKILTADKKDKRLVAIQAFNYLKNKIPFTDGITYFGFDEKLNFGLINNTGNSLPNWLEKQYSLYQVYSLNIAIGD